MQQGTHDEDKTLMRAGVAELRSDEYQAVPSWQTNEHTVHVGEVAVPKAALPSDYPPPHAGGISGDRTMIMQGAPVQPGKVPAPPPSTGGPPATQPLPGHGRGAFTSTHPFPARHGSDPNLSPVSAPPNDMMFVAGPARPPPVAGEGGGSRALVFIAVGLVSMVIVIVTGLIILAASD